MKKTVGAIVVSLVLFGLTFGAQKDTTFTGEISDLYCAKANSHDLMMKRHAVKTVEDCIPACVKAGGKYVLVDASNRIYVLDDQKKPEPFARQKVKITGTLDKATETIHVKSIEREK